MTSPPNNILLINEGLSDNFGDQAIKASMEQLIADCGYNCSFQDLTREKTRYSYHYDIKAVVKEKNFITPFKSFLFKCIWLSKNIKRVYLASRKDYQAVIIGGGQLLLPNGIFPLALFFWVFFLKRKNKNKIFMFSIGTQGKYSKIQKYLISLTLKNIKTIYVRDARSHKILADIFNKESLLTYDSAFSYRPEVELSSENYYDLQIGIVDYNVYLLYSDVNLPILSREEYYEEWLKADNIGTDHRKISLIYSTVEDRHESLQFQEYLSQRLNLKVDLLENNSSDEFIYNLSKAKKVFSGRMHTLILSLVLKKQVKLYPISEKLEQLVPIINEKYSMSDIQSSILLDFKGLLQGNKS